MKILIDTNIVIDVLAKREPFHVTSAQILRLSETGKITAFITANSVTDIVYILRKYIPDKSILTLTIQNLLSIVDVADILKTDVLRAFELDFSDYEDALQARCARRIKANYIVTRNPSDFANSSVPALTPESFLKELGSIERSLP
ncbi:MAG: PIN domain-containing protein [Firmicutes bacterium]|nr:PIN domain-containing protein [Bacillota bacterium]